MLYNNFIVCAMVCAFMALLNMINNQDWEYLILPIGIIIWGFFKFFDEDDREYLRRNGIDPDEFNAFFPDYYDSGYSNRNSYHHREVSHSLPRRKGNTITWGDINSAEDVFDSSLLGGETTSYDRFKPNTTALQNQAYKGMVKKCRRNFKISINEDESKERKSIFHSFHNSGE